MKIRSALVAFAAAAFIAAGGEPAVAAPLASYSALTIESPAPEAFSRWGALMHTVGDIDGDGVKDIAVDADGASSGGVGGTGRVWILSGRTGAVLLTLDHPEPQQYTAFGAGMAGLGDVNGDGVPDLAISAPYQNVYTGSGTACGQPKPNGCNESQGKIYVFSGKNGKLLYSVDAPHPQPKAYFGALNLTGTGDLNGDGIPDFVATENGENVGGTPNVGAAYALSGKDGSVIHRITSPQPETYTSPGGEDIFSMGENIPGDVNGDGVDDILLGYTGQTVNGVKRAGRAYLFSGKTGSLIRTIDDPNPEPNAQFGSGYSDPGAPGDVNGDGVRDILVDAEGHSVSGLPGAGQAYLFSGKDGSLLRTFTTPFPQDSAFFGFIFSDAGDLNHDGTHDLLIAQTGSFHMGGAYAQGGAWVFDPRTGNVLADFTSIAPDAGQGIASPGDANGDGTPDYFVGAPRTDVGAVKRQGRVFQVLSHVPVSQPVLGAVGAQTDSPSAQTAVARDLAISPSAFFAAHGGPSVRGAAATRRRRLGARVTYRLNTAASVRFTIERAVNGRRVGGHCAPQRKSNRKRRRCTRYSRVQGSFVLHGQAGRNNFRFMGRLNGKRLRRGRYRLVAVPSLNGRNGRSVRKTFRIR